MSRLLLRHLTLACLTGALSLLAAACGLESAGRASPGDGGDLDAGLDVTIDHGTGVTDAGTRCTCLPDPGPGWTFGAYLRDGPPACSPEYAGGQKVAVEASGPPATCGCSCTGSGATCTVVSSSVQVGQVLNCPSIGSTTYNPGADCFDVNPDFNAVGPVWVKATANVTVNGGTCNAPAPTKTVAPPEVHTGGVCALSASFGSGCGQTDTCVPNPGGGLGLCIFSANANAACPTGYPNKKRVGSAFTDGRDCGACTCAPAFACTATGQFHADNGCGGNKKDGQSFVENGNCQQIAIVGLQGHSISTTAAASQACTAQGFQPTGAFTFTGEYTICCP